MTVLAESEAVSDDAERVERAHLDVVSLLTGKLRRWPPILLTRIRGGGSPVITPPAGTIALASTQSSLRPQELRYLCHRRLSSCRTSYSILSG